MTLKIRIPVIAAFAFLTGLSFAQGQATTYTQRVSLGSSLLEAGRNAEAFEECKRAFSLDRNRWEAVACAGFAAGQLNRLDDASAFLAQALVLSPAEKRGPIREALEKVGGLRVAATRFASADYQGAATYLDGMMQQYPNSFDLYFRAASAWRLAKRADRFRAILEGVLARATEPQVLSMARALIAVDNAGQQNPGGQTGQRFGVAKQPKDCVLARHVLESLTGEVRETPEWLAESAAAKLCTNQAAAALVDFEKLGRILPSDRGVLASITNLRAAKARDEAELARKARREELQRRIATQAQALIAAVRRIGPVMETRTESAVSVTFPMTHSADDWNPQYGCSVHFRRTGQGVSKKDHGYQLHMEATQWWTLPEKAPPGEVLLSDGGILRLKRGHVRTRAHSSRKNWQSFPAEHNSEEDFVFHDLNPDFTRFLYDTIVNLQNLCAESAANQ